MSASTLSSLLLSALLLSVQAEQAEQYCGAREILRYTMLLLGDGSLSCPCRQAAGRSCSCLPIPEPGHELACFVEGTQHMLNTSVPSDRLTRLHRTFQAQLDRNLCESLSRGDQCQYKTKGTVKEFLHKIKTTYQEMNKSSP